IGRSQIKAECGIGAGARGRTRLTNSADRSMGRSANWFLENNKRAPLEATRPVDLVANPSTCAVSLVAPALVIRRHSQPPELITRRSGRPQSFQAIDQVRFLLIIEPPRRVSEGDPPPSVPAWRGATIQKPEKSLWPSGGGVTVPATGVHYG